jgi:hypothetical protein
MSSHKLSTENFNFYIWGFIALFIIASVIFKPTSNIV